MSRAAVLEALRGDAALNALVPPTNILPNYSKEGRPNNLTPGAFIVLRWGALTPDLRVGGRGPRELGIWAHYPSGPDNGSTDFGIIDQILTRVREILEPLEQVAGGDGVVLVSAKYAGESEDQFDPAFQTIMRNSTFRVLSSRTS
jgi:hypothetical protein